ncbi:LysR family transcriptional regulator [Streptomyces sp. NPDC057543]|uniref:LysR family transcriptional regulator n=1 Tax=Streptomyces sp. NPDC057543 TaxID=3346163 RepID=UPI00368AF24B
MNYRRLLYFLAVVEAGTITSAAATLHVAQPGLSRQLKTLEREMRMTLFEPRGNRLALTPAGRAFVPLARRLIAETRTMEDAVEVLRSGRVSQLVVAATPASIRGFLAGFIATTGPADPPLLTRQASHFHLDEELLDEADLIVSPAARAAGFEAVDLGGSPLKAYVAPGHAWARAGRTEVDLAELCGSRIFAHSRSSVSRAVLENALGQRRLVPARLTECDDGPTVEALAVAGHGIGVSTDLPRLGAHGLRITGDRSSTREGSDGDVLQVPLHVAWLPGHFAADLIESMALRLRDYLAGQPDAVIPPPRPMG